eukprot:scaffold249442_cov28-Tisochrysis_lutea.AAC.1
MLCEAPARHVKVAPDCACESQCLVAHAVSRRAAADPCTSEKDKQEAAEEARVAEEQVGLF